MSIDMRRCAADARRAIFIASKAVKALGDRLDASFADAVRLIASSRGHLVTSGVGKSGIAANKIAATFASTGVRSMFIHAADACHGDLGMVGKDDVGLLVSNSGESEELLRIVPFFKRYGIPIIALSGDARSSLAKCSDCWLDISVDAEVGGGLVAMASTIAAVAMGDALAVAVMTARQPTVEELAAIHPGGLLGAKLRDAVTEQNHMAKILVGAE